MCHQHSLEVIKNDIIESVRRNIPVIGVRNPMVGNGAPNFDWHYPDEYFWTDSFWTGQLWLAYSLTGDQSSELLPLNQRL